MANAWKPLSVENLLFDCPWPNAILVAVLAAKTISIADAHDDISGFVKMQYQPVLLVSRIEDSFEFFFSWF